MKAAQIETYGSADKIKIVDTATPACAGGQVLIAVHAASINPFDTTVREGKAQDWLSLTLPVTLGGDVAGTVTEVAPDVMTLHIGDKVYGQAGVAAGGSGAFAEFAVTSAHHVAKMPGNVTFAEAGAVPLTGVSAVQVITEHMKLQRGQKILIHGGAGGIGTIAIQIAKHIGAHVAATATGEGLDYVKQLGADEIIDYTAQRFDELVHDYDAVFDTIGGETYDRSFTVLKKGGVLVSMLMPPKHDLMEQYGVTAIAQHTDVTTELLDKLTALIESGIATIHVDATYPLSQVTEAFEARESGTVRGKVVVEVVPNK